jgi:hypothetical protein
MGRRRRIERGAKGTTISLTSAQHLVIRKLQTKRLEEGAAEPLLNELVLEGLKLVCKEEGWSPAELEVAFPKQEVQTAEIRVIPKRRRSRDRR